MEGVFNSRDLYDYLQHHLSTNTTVTHKLSMYFKATQKPFDPDHYMLQIWLDYIQLLIETEDDINDIKSTLYILRKGYYRFKEYWTVYLSFEERFFGVDKRMKFVTESVRFLESKREFEGKKEIIGFLMAAQGHNRTGDGCSGLANSDGSELLSDDLKGTGWNVPIVNEINDGMSASTKGNLRFTNKVSLDTAIYHTPSSLNENKINCPIEKEDYTESITESLDKMMNRRLKRCGFDGTSIGDSKLGIEPSSRNYDVVRSIRSVRRSIERDFGTTNRNMDRVVLNGKELQVMSVIGKGGSSKVYKVSYSDNFFALKVIKNVTDRKILQSYENEINLMIKLKGTAETIELCDYAINQDEEGYTILLLMEYGESDLTHLLKNKELKTEDIFDIFWQMLMNMDAIYDQRIIHADLKPANFVICRNKLKLIDFGISKEIRTDTTNVIQESKVGTINYMSPESLYGNKTSRRSDIWSLGVILYEMIYKKNFMDGMNCWQKIDFLKGPDPVHFPDEKMENNTFDELQKICAMCLIKDPDRRPTVKDLIDLVKEHKAMIRVKRSDIKTLVRKAAEITKQNGYDMHLLIDRMVDEFIEEMRRRYQ